MVFKLCSITPFSLVNSLSMGELQLSAVLAEARRKQIPTAGVTGWCEPPGVGAQSQMSHGGAARACSY